MGGSNKAKGSKKSKVEKGKERTGVTTECRSQQVTNCFLFTAEVHRGLQYKCTDLLG
jgi:hypothetical protein